MDFTISYKWKDFSFVTVPLKLSTSPDRYHLPYREIMGGVVALQRSHIMAMNGFSNHFYGWGAEDDNLAQRIQQLGFTLTRFDPAVASYITLPHQRVTPAQDRFTTLSKVKESMKKDGLNSLNYKVMEREDRPLYTWLLVSCWGSVETVKWYSKLSLYTVAHRHAEDINAFISITVVLCVVPSVLVHCIELGPDLLWTLSHHIQHITLLLPQCTMRVYCCVIYLPVFQ